MAVRYMAQLAVDFPTGWPVAELLGAQGAVVYAGTSSPASISEDEEGSVPIPGGILEVTGQNMIPGFWLQGDPTDELEFLSGEYRCPLVSLAGVAETASWAWAEAEQARIAANASAQAAENSYASIPGEVAAQLSDPESAAAETVRNVTEEAVPPLVSQAIASDPALVEPAEQAVQDAIAAEGGIVDATVAGLVAAGSGSDTEAELAATIDAEIPAGVVRQFADPDAGAETLKQGRFQFAPRPLNVYKPTDQTRANDASTGSLDNDLIVPLAPNTAYRLSGHLEFDAIDTSGGGSNPNAKLFWRQASGGGSTALERMRWSGIGANLNIIHDDTLDVYGPGDIARVTLRGNRPVGVHVTGTLLTNDSGGTLQLGWSQNVASPVDVTLKAGSYIAVDPMPAPVLVGPSTTFAGTECVVQTPGKPWNIEKSGDNVRIELRHGDEWAGDPTGNDHRERCEFAGTTRYPHGTDIWVAFDYRRFGDPTNFIGGQYHFIHQLIQPGLGGPILSFNYQPDGSLKIGPYYTIPEVAEGQVYRFVCHYRTDDTGADSAIEVWLDGTKVVDEHNIPFGHPYTTVSERVQVKFGQYRSQTLETIVSEYGNVALGTTDLSDRVANPLPWPFN